MFDPNLSRALKLFPLVAILILLLLSPFAAVLDSRPVSNEVVLLILAGMGVLTIATVRAIMMSRSPLTLRQERRLARRRIDAAMRGEHWQEDIRFRDEMLKEQVNESNRD